MLGGKLFQSKDDNEDDDVVKLFYGGKIFMQYKPPFHPFENIIHHITYINTIHCSLQIFTYTQTHAYIHTEPYEHKLQ